MSDQPWRSRGYLPHFDQPGLIQSITYRCADALPREALAKMVDECSGQPESERSIYLRASTDRYLDAGFGDCPLADMRCAQVVEANLLHFDSVRYRLLAWVVMPNHVHVLIQTLPGWELGKIVQSWKSYTAKRIIGLRNEPAGGRRSLGPERVWQREYWDRWIRDEVHFRTTLAYIEGNPVDAGLCPEPSAWRCSSAGYRVATPCS